MSAHRIPYVGEDRRVQKSRRDVPAVLLVDAVRTGSRGHAAQPALRGADHIQHRVRHRRHLLLRVIQLVHRESVRRHVREEFGPECCGPG